jgi:hypothetical protein
VAFLVLTRFTALLPPGKDCPAHLSPDEAQALHIDLAWAGTGVTVYTHKLSGGIKWIGSLPVWLNLGHPILQLWSSEPFPGPMGASAPLRAKVLR